MRRGATWLWQLGRGNKVVRSIVLVIYAYLALVLVGNAVILAAVAGARIAGKDPRADLLSLPDVKHLRQVDRSTWAGATPSAEDFEKLAAMGISTVINLREGVPGDEAGTSRYALDAGLEYVRIPVVDGRALDQAEVDRLLEAIDRADGGVFIHCGGGVGRTTSATAAYEAAVGRDPSFWRRVAIGPVSFEQAWLILEAGPGEPSPDAPIVEALSRYVIDAPRRIVNWIEVVF